MTVADHETEEYLEHIYRLAGRDGIARTTQIAEIMNIKPGSVTEELKRLASKGLVEYTPYKGARLTQKGFKRARRLTRKHRLAERFLQDRLKLEAGSVHDQACEMEHTLSDEADEALCRMLGGPELCPHGKPIPPCDADVESCRECLEKNEEEFKRIKKRKSQVISILSIEPGQKAKIAFIRGGCRVIQRLCELGMTPGTEVFIERAAPMSGPVKINVRGSSVAVGRGIAQKIYVRTG